MRSGGIASASVRRVTLSSSCARSESAVATPSSSRKLPRSLTLSRWMRTFCHSSSRRSFSTTASVPRLDSSADFSAAGSSTGISR